MAEHPLFEKLMERLDEIDLRIERIEMTMSGVERQTSAAYGEVGQLLKDFHDLADDARRRERLSWLTAQAQENIRRAS